MNLVCHNQQHGRLRRIEQNKIYLHTAVNLIADVTNNRRLRSTYRTIDALHADTKHRAASAIAELLVLVQRIRFRAYGVSFFSNFRILPISQA